MSRFIKLLTASVLIFLCASLSPAEVPWRGFRGAQAQGHSETPFQTLDWSAGGSRLWSVSITGGGASSPIVSNGRIYVTTSWESRWSHGLRQLLCLALLLAAAACLAGVWRSRVSGRRAWIAMLGLLCAASTAPLWWPSLQPLIRTPLRATLLGSLQMTALAVAAYGLLDRGKWTRLLCSFTLLLPLIWLAWHLNSLETQPPDVPQHRR
jgi:hypothetical protein